MIESLRNECRSFFPTISRQTIQEGMLDSAKKALGLGIIGIGAQVALNAVMDKPASLIMRSMPETFLILGMGIAAFALFFATRTSKTKNVLSIIGGYSVATSLVAEVLIQIKSPLPLATILRASSGSSITGGLVAAAGIGLSTASHVIAKAVQQNLIESPSESSKISSSEPAQPQEKPFDLDVLCLGSLVPGSLACAAGTLFTAVGGSFSSITLAALAAYQVTKIQKILKKEISSNDQERAILALIQGSVKAAKLGAWIAAIGALISTHAESFERVATCAIVLGVTSHLQDR